jgi:hypothetical protein
MKSCYKLEENSLQRFKKIKIRILQPKQCIACHRFLWDDEAIIHKRKIYARNSQVLWNCH